MAPGIEPIPPMTIVQTTKTDSMNVNDSGLTNCWKFANVRPAMPPHSAPSENAHSLACSDADAHRGGRDLVLAHRGPRTAEARLVEAAHHEDREQHSSTMM